MIEINHISKSFYGKEVLRDINLEIQKGEKIALVGSNGCGKSTLINIIAGLVTPNVGSVTVEGFSAQHASYRRLVGFVLDSPLYIQELSIKEMFEFNAVMYNLSPETCNDRKSKLLKLFELESELNSKIGDLSKGYKARTSLALSLLHNPEYLILDEPFNAIEESLVDIIIDYLSCSDLGILVTAHDKPLISKLTQRIINL